MEFRNIDKFEKWLKEVLKNDDFDINLYLGKVENESDNGYEDVEIGRLYTKSGNPEIYNFDVEIKYYIDNELIVDENKIDEFDYVEKIITF